MSYEHKDYYYKKAKAEGKASRASYKLIELQQRFQLIKKGDRVVDLGAAPGGWFIELSKLVGPKGRVIGVDLAPLEVTPPANAAFLHLDLEAAETLEAILQLLGGKADVVVSDMAPKTSGVGFADAYRSYELAMLALETARELLKKGGYFLVKLLPGEDLKALQLELRQSFEKIHHVVPQATRKTSSEIYLVCSRLK